MKLKIILFIVLAFILFQARTTYAYENSSKSSAFLAQERVDAKDSRVEILKTFLEKYDSPLTEFAHVFVESADEYNIDWRLVAAIAGLESGFGKQIPTNSYNAWGWGVYGDNVIYFTSWEDGIKTITHGIRQRYMNERGATNVHEIGNTYAASPTWAQRVEMWMGKIGEVDSLDPSQTLSISL